MNGGEQKKLKHLELLENMKATGITFRKHNTK
jgi:hypothetical protein